MQVKQLWLAQKRNMEKRLIKENRMHEVNAKIFKLARERDSPSPRYKSQQVLHKYNLITEDSSKNSLLIE